MNENEFIGSVFAGCKIIEKIGQGGMGSVYKAEHLALGKTVCVKLLSKELSFDQRNIEFFMREARSASKLDHPNIVHVYSFGEEKGLYFIVMSYVEGNSLEDIVKEKKKLSIPEASDFIIGILEGLAHAHSKNIIHRDIKPSNILVTKDGTPRIADFGLARSVNEEKQLTIAGEMVGTAYFMSPEQGLAAKVDTRADLYAVGGTFFYLITGKYPYEGKTSIEVISKHINEPLPNLYQLMPEIPLWTAKVIEKLMKKNPDDRYQKAEEALEEMKKYKENGYQDKLHSDNESTFDLDDLKKSWPSPENVQVNKDRYDGFSLDEEKKDSQKKEDSSRKEPDQIFDPKKAKFQLGMVYKLTRFIYHLGLLFSAAIFSMLGGAFASMNYTHSPDFLQNIFSSSMKNPVYSIGCLLLGILSAFLSSKAKPFKTTPGHFLFSILFCLCLYCGAAALAYPENQDVFSRIFINLYTSVAAGFSEPNRWLLSASFFIFYFKLSKFDRIYFRIAGALLLAFGLIFFFSFSKWACAVTEQPSDKTLLYSALAAAAVSVILAFFRKNLILVINPSIFYLAAIGMIFAHDFSYLSNRFFQESIRNEEARYQRELEIYQIKNSSIEYEETGEYDAEGRPVMKQKQMEKLAPPVKKDEAQIKSESSPKALEAVMKRTWNQVIRSGGLLFFAFILFILLNAMYWEETSFYEKNYLQV